MVNVRKGSKHLIHGITSNGYERKINIHGGKE